MDYFLPIILIITYSAILVIINLISIKYNEHDRLSDTSKKLLSILTLIVLTGQIILILGDQIYVSSVMILLYAPGIAVAKYAEEKAGLNATKNLIFFGLLFFGVSFSYLIVPKPILTGFQSSTDLRLGLTIFGISGAFYLALSIFFGCIFITDKYGTKMFDQVAMEWVKGIGNFFLIAAFLGISISILNYIILDRNFVRLYFDIIILFLIMASVVFGIIDIIFFITSI
ncbi:MAG: hypothetical protein ACTSO9_13700 [Candidatus Helarchaeota archaeon]